MAINNRYMKGDELLKKATKSEEKDDKEENDDTVEMSLKDFVKEHTSLIKILKSGTKAEQLKEARSQQKELQKYL